MVIINNYLTIEFYSLIIFFSFKYLHIVGNMFIHHLNKMENCFNIYETQVFSFDDITKWDFSSQFLPHPRVANLSLVTLVCMLN